jgi:hypothetical protein
MKIRIVGWREADPDQLRDLYLHFPYPPYFGSPIVDDRLQAYRFHQVLEAAEADPGTLLAGVAGDRVLCAAQLRRTTHLSDHFGIEVASIANEAFACNGHADNVSVFNLMVETLRRQAQDRGVAFLSTYRGIAGLTVDPRPRREWFTLCRRLPALTAPTTTT